MVVRDPGSDRTSLPTTPEELLEAVLESLRGTDLWSEDLDTLAKQLRASGSSDDVYRAHAGSVMLAAAVYRHYWPLDAQATLEPLADILRDRVGPERD
jgi:hypothetical protein